MCAAGTSPAQDPGAERSARHARILQRIAEIGMNLAEAVDLQRQDPDIDPGELAMKFARIAKAVRQTLVLEARLADEGQLRREAEAHRMRDQADGRRRAARAEGLRRKDEAADRLERALYDHDPDYKAPDVIELMEDWRADEADLERFAALSLEEAIVELGRSLGWRIPPEDDPALVAAAATAGELAAFLLTDSPPPGPLAAPPGAAGAAAPP